MDVDDRFYFADVANAAVFYREQPDEDTKNPEMQILIKDYEGMPLKGPCSISYNKEENSLFVCDSGYFGSTSLNTPTGSVFLIDLDTKVCRPILINCLSNPADIIFDESTGIAYIVETFSNRILRLIQNPNGVLNTSLFHPITMHLNLRHDSTDLIRPKYSSK